MYQAGIASRLVRVDFIIKITEHRLDERRNRRVSFSDKVIDDIGAPSLVCHGGFSY